MGLIGERTGRRARFVLATIGAVILASLATSASAQNQPRIFLDPAAGAPGTQVIVTGDGFDGSPSATDVGLYWNSLDAFLGAIAVYDDGSLEPTIVFIPEGEPGSYDIIAAQNDESGQAVAGTPVRAEFQLQRQEASSGPNTGGGSAGSAGDSGDRTSSRTGGSSARRGTDTSPSSPQRATEGATSGSGTGSSRTTTSSAAAGGGAAPGITGGSVSSGYSSVYGSSGSGSVGALSGSVSAANRSGTRPPRSTRGSSGGTNKVVAAPVSSPAAVATGAPPVTSEDLWTSLDVADRPSLDAVPAGARSEDRSRLAAGVALLAAGVVALVGGALAAALRRRHALAEPD